MALLTPRCSTGFPSCPSPLPLRASPPEPLGSSSSANRVSGRSDSLSPCASTRFIEAHPTSVREGGRPPPPAPAAITRVQVLLAWDGRIADGRVAPAIALAQQA